MRNFTNSIKKYVFAGLAMFVGLAAMAQVPGAIGTDLSDGNYTVQSTTNYGLFNQYRIQATVTAASGVRKLEFPEFVGAGGFSNVWRTYVGGTLPAYNTMIDPSTQAGSARYNSGFGGTGILMPAITSGNYYTVNIMTNNGFNSDTMAVLETSYLPVTILSVSIPLDTNTVGPACSPTVVATLSAAPSAGEYVYLRYSTTGFLDSSIVIPMTVVGTTATCQIPAYPNGTHIDYYVLTSPVGTLMSTGPGSGYYDCLTLNLKTGSIGNNFRYTVKNLPIPSVSITASLNPVCSGTSDVFTANGVNNGSVASDYQWYKNGIAVGINDSIYTDAALANNDSVWVVMTANLGCPVNDTSNHLILTVNPLPSPTSRDTSVCPGNSIDLSTLVSGNSNPLIYRQDSLLGVTVSNMVTINNTTQYVVLDSNTTTSCYASTNITATAIPLTYDSVYVVASHLSYCNHVGVDTFIAIPIGGGTNPTYQWTIAENPVATGDTFITGAYDTLAGNAFQVIMTSNAACPSPSPAMSDPFFITLYTNSTYTQFDTICQGSSFVENGHTYTTTNTYMDTFFSASSTGCDSIVTTNLTVKPYARYTQNLSICQGQSVTVGSHTYSTTNMYMDTLTGAAVNGCDSIVTTNLTVLPLPAMPNAVSNQTVCPNMMTAADTFSGSGSSAVYNWTAAGPAIGLPTTSGTDTVPSFASVNAGATPLIDTITVTPVSANGFAYVTNFGDNTVSVVNTGTGQIVTTIPVGVNPEGVSVAPNGSAVYIANRGDNTISVINTASNTVSATITVGAGPVGTVVSPDGSNVYTANYADNTVSVISTATNTVTNTITVGNTPWGIAISPDGSSVYAANYSSNTVSVINTASNTVVATIPAGNGSWSVSVSPNGSNLYVANQTDNTVSVISTATNTITTTVPVGSNPWGVSVSPNGLQVYIANQGDNTVSVISTASNTVTNTVPVGNSPDGLYVSPNGSTVYVACESDNAVSVISTASNTVTNTITGFNTPVAFGNFISSASGCTGPARTYTITVNPTPTVNPSADQTVCNNSNTTTVSFTGSVAGTIYNWTGTDGTIGIATSGTGDITSFTATNAGSTPVTDTLIVTPSYTNNGVTCTGTPDTFMITVNPTPTVNPSADQTVCNNSNTTTVSFTGSVAGTVYNWTGTDGSIGIATSGTGDITSFTATNAGSTPVTDTIIVTPSYTNNGVTCTGTPDTFMITVNPTPTVNPSADQTVCNNSNTTTVSFTGSVAGTVYNWTGTNGTIGIATSGTGDITSFTATNAGSAPVTDTIIVTPSYTNNGVTCTGTPDTFMITVNPTPTVNPSADQTVCNNSNTTTVSFTGSVAGTVYNWTGTDGTIGIATSGTGDITSFTATNAGSTPVTDTLIVTPSYTNNGVTCTGTPDTFMITVNPTPTVNPSADQTVCNNSNTTTVSFTGLVAGTVYNWTGTDGTIGIATSGTGDITSFTATNAGSTAVTDTIIVTPSYTNNGVTCTGTPDTFMITVNPTPTVNPSADQTVCNNSNTTTVSFTGSVAGTVYNWTGTDGTIGIATSGTGDITSFTATNAGSTAVTDTLIVTPSYTNNGVTCTGTPDTFMITVNPTPTVNPSADQTVCNNSNTTTVSFTGSVAGTVYNWTGTDGSIGIATSGTGDITSFTATNAGSTAVTDTLIVTPSYTNNGVTCTGTPDTFMITVNPTPTVNPSADQTVCNNSNTTTVSFTGSVAGSVYNWTGTDGTIGIATSGTGDITSFTATNAGSTPVTDTLIVTPSYTNNGVTCTGTPDTFMITVNPTPTVNPSADQTVCNNSNTTTVSFTGSVAGTVYNWTGTDGTIGIATSGTGDITSFTATNAGSTPVTDTIIVTPSYTNNGVTCTGTPDTFMITVNPTPTVNPSADQTVCNNSNTTTVSFTGSVAGTVYNWTGTNGTIGIATSGTGDITSFTATNAGSAPVTDTIIVTPSYTNNGVTCTGTPDTFMITVNPTPTVNPSADQTVCNNSNTTTVSFTGSVAGTVYNWTGTDGSIGIATSGTGDITSFTATNAGSTPVTDTLIVTPSYTNNGVTCTGTPDTFMITVNPTPTVNPSADQTVCNNSNTTTVSFTGSVAGTVYNWTGTDGSIGIATSGTGDITSFTATNAGSTPVTDTIIVTPSYTNNGVTCTGTPDTFMITVNPTPVMAVPSNQAVCNGDTTTTVTFTSTVAGTTYSWTGTNGTIGLATSGNGNITSFTTVNPTTSDVIDTVTVTPTSPQSCVGAPVTFTITVHPTPLITLGPNVVQCGGNVKIDAGNPGSTYTWSNLVTSEIDTVSTSGLYTVTVTSQYGCIDSASKTVYINSAPVVDLGPTRNICADSTILDAGNPGDTYLWTGGSTGQFLTVTNTGQYSVTVTDTSGACSSTGSVQVNISPMPAIYLGNDTAICGGSIVLDAKLANATYMWSNGDTTRQITVTSTGNYSVTVTNSSGCQATGSIFVSVYTKPNLGADVTDSICPYTRANLYNYYVNSGLTMTYSTPTPSSVDTGTYTVIGTNSNGCSDTALIHILYRQTPNAGADKTDSICLGYKYNLTTLYPNVGYTTYTWNTPNPTAVDAGTYTLVVTGPNGCSDTAVATILLRSRPNLGGNKTDSVCRGYTYNLTTLYPNTGYASYTWTGVANDSAVTVGTYQLIVTNASGCSDTAYATITQRAQPVVTIPAFRNQCSTNPSFPLTGAIPAGGTYYVDNVMDSIFRTHALGAGTHHVVYVYTNASGCTDSASHNVIIYPQPQIVDTTAIPTLCSGSPLINLNNYFAPPGGVFSGIGVSGTYFYPSLVPAGSDSITYIYTDENGCIDTAGRRVTVLPAVHVTLHTTQSNLTICQGQSITFTADGAIDYQFFVNDSAWTTLDTTSTFTTTALSNHDQIKVVGTNGCSSDTSDYIIIDVNPAPTVTAGPDTTIDLGQTVQLYSHATGSSALIYVWAPDSFLNTSTIPNPLFSGTDTTTYQLKVTDANGCFATALVTINVNVPDNVQLPNVITPNGDGKNDQWILNSKIDLTGSHLVIFNRWGELVYEVDNYNNDWAGTYKATGQKVPDGTYYYVLTVPTQHNHIYKGPINVLDSE